MSTANPILILTLALTGSAARPQISASPQVRGEAVRMILDDRTIGDIAAAMALQPAEARELVRSTLFELNHAYYRGE